MSAVPESFLGAAANDADAQETREWPGVASTLKAAQTSSGSASNTVVAAETGVPRRQRLTMRG